LEPILPIGPTEGKVHAQGRREGRGGDLGGVQGQGILPFLVPLQRIDGRGNGSAPRLYFGEIEPVGVKRERRPTPLPIPG
jgi:hypothetical protein